MAFGLALSVIKIAMKHGGRAYSTGIYFKRHADEILGAERVKAMQAYKAQVDPKGIMNPGKVCGNGSLTTLMGLAETFEPAHPLGGATASMPIWARSSRAASTACRTRSPATPTPAPSAATASRGAPSSAAAAGSRPRRGASGTSCARCSRDGRRSPRSGSTSSSSARPARSARPSARSNLPIEPAWGSMRGALIQDQGRMTFPPFEMMAASMRKEGNIWAELSRRTGPTGWTTICEQGRGRQGQANDRLLRRLHGELHRAGHRQGFGQAAGRGPGSSSPTWATEENCCGIPMLISGRWDVWEANMRRERGEHAGDGSRHGRHLLPGVLLVWKTYYPQWCEKLGIEYHLELLRWPRSFEKARLPWRRARRW